MYRTFLF